MKDWFFDINIIIKNYFKSIPKNFVNNFKNNIKGFKSFIINFSLTRYWNNTRQFVKRPLLPLKLYKMLIRSFLYWFLIAIGLFVVIFVIFDFFTKLDDYIRSSVSTLEIFYITFLFAPKAMWVSMPIAVMFGITMALSSFYQNNELIAIFTSGISIYKFVIPIILINLFLSIFMIFADSYIVIPTYRYRENLFEHLTDKSEIEDRDILVKGENNYFWNIHKFISSKNMLQKVIVFRVNDDYRIVYRLDSSSAIYTKDGWLFNTGTIKEWDNTGDLVSETIFHKKVVDLFVEKPVVFRNVFKKSDYDIEKMTIPEAKKRIELLQKLNIDHADESLDFFKKYSFPFTLLVVCLFAIGVSTVSQKNIIILSLFFSIGLAILYYVMQLILDVLASNGRIPAIVGAWFAILVFLPIAIHLVRKAKT